MRAEVITETVYEGFMDRGHGGGYEIYRIVVPEANNLAITVDEHNTGKHLYIWENFKRDETCKVIKEIQIPDELVKQITEFMKKREEIASQLENFLT